MPGLGYALRPILKSRGFYMLQRSVLVTPWECKDEVDFIKYYYGLGNCVNLIKARSFEGEDSVKNFFGLD